MLVTDVTGMRFYLWPGDRLTSPAYGYMVCPKGRVYVWARHREYPDSAPFEYTSWPLLSDLFPREADLLTAGYELLGGRSLPAKTSWGAYVYYAPPEYIAQIGA